MTVMAGVDVPTVNDAGLFVTAQTYGEFLGLSHPTVCKMCREGEVPAVRVGKQWRIPIEYVRKQTEVAE